MDILLKLKRLIYKNKTPSECVVYTMVFCIFTLIAFSYVYVLFWCMISGMRTHKEVTLLPFVNMFEGLQPIKIIQVFDKLTTDQTGFVGMLINSLYFSITSVVVNIFCTASFAYVTTKYEFPGSKLVYSIVMVLMVLPIYGTSGATYKLYVDMGLINNPLQAIVCSTSGLGMGYLYFNAFYRGLSNTYKEAAEIDGAGDYTIFFQIVIPQAMGLITALFLTSWIGGWNGYEGFLIYMPGLPNLAAGLYLFQVHVERTAQWEYVYGACFIIAIPPLILFALFNKTLTSSISLGGIKE
ncbi:MAG: carbohydrate ABC transporter permease [Clostridiales bacterium]|nr:carbohydrate ABC transporter permease [Clostridiales bacterium]